MSEKYADVMTTAQYLQAVNASSEGRKIAGASR
jgi:hypothetical protein